MQVVAADFKADVSALATSAEIASLESHGDGTWATATGFSTHTPADVLTAFGDGSSLGDGMQKLKDIEIKLGHARLSDGKLSKIHNYITLDNQVADLIKRREAV
jgi:hypothetical protein